MVWESRHSWVGNLPDSMKNDEIVDYFSRHGGFPRRERLAPPCNHDTPRRRVVMYHTGGHNYMEVFRLTTLWSDQEEEETAKAHPVSVSLTTFGILVCIDEFLSYMYVTHFVETLCNIIKRVYACLELNAPQKQVNLPCNTATFNLGVGWGKDKVYWLAPFLQLRK